MSSLDATAYRRAEKAYKHYTHELAEPTDFSTVVDCSDIANNTEENRAKLRRVTPPAFGALFELAGCPGLYLAPGVLSEDEQLELVLASATSFHRPPNATNLEPGPGSGPEP